MEKLGAFEVITNFNLVFRGKLRGKTMFLTDLTEVFFDNLETLVMLTNNVYKYNANNNYIKYIIL